MKLPRFGGAACAVNFDIGLDRTVFQLHDVDAAGLVVRTSSDEAPARPAAMQQRMINALWYISASIARHEIIRLKDIFKMVEGRVATRHRVNKQAKMNYGGDKYPCTVRDISTTGAALELPDLIGHVRKAKAFILEIPEDGLKLPCRVVWQSGYRMGVTFD